MNQPSMGRSQSQGFEWNFFECPDCHNFVRFSCAPYSGLSDGLHEYLYRCDECRAELVVTVNVIARIEKVVWP